MSVAWDSVEGVEAADNTAMLILIFAIGGLVVYALYEIYEGKNFCWVPGSSLIWPTTCGDKSSDPSSPNYVEPYGTAAKETLANPLTTLETIFGIPPTTYSTPDAADPNTIGPSEYGSDSGYAAPGYGG